MPNMNTLKVRVRMPKLTNLKFCRNLADLHLAYFVIIKQNYTTSYKTILVIQYVEMTHKNKRNDKA